MKCFKTQISVALFNLDFTLQIDYNMRINFEVKEGEGNVSKDPQYKKMMQELKKIAKKGGELESNVLEQLKKNEQEAVNAKTKKRKAQSSDDAAQPFLIQTKSARFSNAKQKKKDDDDDELGCDDDDNDEVCDDDDDENKVAPSYENEEDNEDNVAETATFDEAPRKEKKIDENFYKEIEEIFRENPLPGMIPTVPVMFIQNMVVTAKTEQPINIKALIPFLIRIGVYQNTKRFVAMTQRRRDPRSSTLCFRNGKFVNTGSRNINDARVAIQSLIDEIKNVEFETSPGCFDRPYSEMEIKVCTVHNIVGSTTVPFEINLDALSKYKFVDYFKHLFVGAIISMYEITQQERDRKAKALVFETAHVIFTGAKTIDHTTELYMVLYPYLARCAKQTSSSSNGGKATKTRTRRVEADKKKASAFSNDSESVIPIDAAYLVDEWKVVNDNRESIETILERERQRKQGTLAGLTKTMKNEIAMHSMKEFAMNQQAQQRENNDPKKRRLLEGGAEKLKTQIMTKEDAKLLANIM